MSQGTEKTMSWFSQLQVPVVIPLWLFCYMDLMCLLKMHSKIYSYIQRSLFLSYSINVGRKIWKDSITTGETLKNITPLLSYIVLILIHGYTYISFPLWFNKHHRGASNKNKKAKKNLVIQLHPNWKGEGRLIRINK